MKKTITTLAMCTFAIPLASQELGRDRLQQAVLIEEREYDLRQADAAYRKIARAENLTDAVRADAWLRIGSLCVRLGKGEGAKTAFAEALAIGGEAYAPRVAALQDPQQDKDRMRKMREKARALIGELQIGHGREPSGLLGTFHYSHGPSAYQDLIWLKDAAALELIVALESSTAKGSTSSLLTRTYSGLLWQIGGNRVVAYAERVRSKPANFRQDFLWGSGNATTEKMHRLAESFFDDSDEVVVVRAMGFPAYTPDTRGRQARFHFTPDATKRRALPLVELTQRTEPLIVSKALDVLTSSWEGLRHRDGPEATAKTLVPVVDRLLRDPDPRVSRAANRCCILMGAQTTQTQTLFFNKFLSLNFDGSESPWGRGNVKLHGREKELVRIALALPGVARLRPNMLSHQLENLRVPILKSLAEWPTEEFEAGCALLVKGWDWPTGDRLAETLRKLATSPERQYRLTTLMKHMKNANAWVFRLGHERVSVATCDALVAWSATQNQPNEGLSETLISVLSRSASAKFWPAIMDLYEPHSNLYPVTSGGLIRIDREATEPSLRELLRRMLLADIDRQKYRPDQARNGIFEYLVSRGDREAIELFPVAYDKHLAATQESTLPSHIRLTKRNGSSGEVRVRGIQWLFPLMTTVGEWRELHAYETADLVRCIRTLLEASNDVIFEDLSEIDFGPTLREEVAAYLIDWAKANLDDDSPEKEAASEAAWAVLASLLEEYRPNKSKARADLRTWAYAQRGTGWDARAAESAPVDASEAERAINRELLASTYKPAAQAAFHKFSDLKDGWLKGDELEAFLIQQMGSKNAWIRHDAMVLLVGLGSEAAIDALLELAKDPQRNNRSLACEYLGQLVSVRGVPALMGLLKGTDLFVRGQAKIALDKIRYYHSEKKYWDKVFAGTETSPTSAASELLEQAKPDKDKKVRLMAIASLGSLGVPETLPFLIRYAQEKDAEIADAATQAVHRITQK